MSSSTSTTSATPVTAVTPSDILALSMNAQPSLPASQIRRPSTFLSLAPTTSASYPTQRPFSPTSITSPTLATIAPATPAAPAMPATPATTVTTASQAEEDLAGAMLQQHHRRSSSLASDASSTSGKMRFLKLGPVHWGEGDGTGDWSEVISG